MRSGINEFCAWFTKGLDSTWLQYVRIQNHPQLDSNVSHAWFELGNFIFDITYDHSAGTYDL